MTVTNLRHSKPVNGYQTTDQTEEERTYAGVSRKDNWPNRRSSQTSRERELRENYLGVRQHSAESASDALIGTDQDQTVLIGGVSVF